MKGHSLVEHRAISALGMLTGVDPPTVGSSNPGVFLHVRGR